MNFRIISALVLRYLFLYTRSPMRLIELVFWPIVELVVWGSLTMFLQKKVEIFDPNFAKFVVFLIGGVILWDVLFRAQQGVAISFLEDVWTRNLINVFVAPVRTSEFVSATFVIGFLRICVTVMVLSVVAAVAYNFNVFVLRWSILPFFANLMVFGWSLGMISTALILRWGQAAESLAWAIPFFIQPLVAVAYPVDSLPSWIQPITQIFPATHIFEGMRDVLNPAIGHASWYHLGMAAGLNVVFMALAAWIFASTLRATRRKGLLTKFATQ